jgi:hypothetical protein
MKQSKIEEQLSSILPNHTQAPSLNRPSASMTQSIAKEAAGIKAKADAKELARIKYIEKCRLQREKAKIEEKQSLAEELGLDPERAETIPTKLQMERVAEHEKNIQTIEAIEAQTVNPLDPVEIAQKSGTYSGKTTQLLQLQGASRPEITKLLTSLNINLSVQLSKQDTANLLACLLTCNESQLNALLSNKKIPVVIKIVIKRLIEDMKLGNIGIVEKLWDRIFGKGAMQLNLPEQAQLQTGILPNVPISREAYVIIRESLMK